MSVINQVLNQLEQRGAHTTLERAMVRPVPHSQRRFAMPKPLLALGLVLATGIAAWQWMQARKPALSLVEGQQVVAANVIQRQQVSAPVPAPVPAPAPAPAVPAVVNTVAGVVDAASAANSGETPLVAMLPPASRLSSELSAIPSPSPSRQSAALPNAKAAPGGSETALPNAKATPDGSEKQPANAAPPAARPQPIQTPNARTAAQASAGTSPMKQVSPAQHVDAEFSKAVASMQQGHIDDAIAGYESVLRLDTGHDAARQALVALLLERKRGAYAERILQDGLKNKPEHAAFAMLLARLQVEHSAVDQAVVTLERSLPYAHSQADYQAFYAALLQRQSRHQEAVTHYQTALQLAPHNGVWLMGYGISLQAVQRNEDARNAFKRALESNTLNPELQVFVQQKIKEL